MRGSLTDERFWIDYTAYEEQSTERHAFRGMDLLRKLLLIIALSYPVRTRVAFHVAPKYEKCFESAIDRIKSIGCPEHDIDKTVGMTQLLQQSIHRLETEPKFVDTCCGSRQYCSDRQLKYYFCL